MGIGVARPILIQKNIKQYMGQQYRHPTRWEKMIVAVMKIYGARAIFLIFCYYQDTKSKSQEI